jgi:hypothetical protein
MASALCSPSDAPTPDSIANGSQIPDDGPAVIIAGSRSATDIVSEQGLRLLIGDALATADVEPDAVISGTADGVDSVGESWATEAGLPIARFPAPWDDTDHADAVVREGKYGPYDAAAGSRRNEWMAEYAAARDGRGVLLAIIDYPSSGTENMVKHGREHLGDENVFVVPLGDIGNGAAQSKFSPVLHRG